eukprot:GHVP01020290.1.p1 GENE.GHVP01020290.1~~GHVP01020290.1.p1  ORF type:complete len:130 (+),score=27.07 GHVP01020290.1:486-875(+)
MCEGFIPEDSGNGGSKESPIYVYVDASTPNEHDDCGRVYKFGEYFVAVAGATEGNEDSDGTTLGILDPEFEDLSCGNTLAECDMDDYAIWTGEMASTTTTTSTIPEESTDDEDSTFFAAVGFTLFALLA